MDFGVTVFPTKDSMPIIDLALEAEDMGFESLLLPEHTHVPVSRQSLWRGQRDMPEEYLHTLDLVAGLAAVAVSTSRIKIGSGVCLVAQRDPIVLAKELATIDVLSGGRLIFGVGGGWNEEEMLNHGVDPNHRWAVAEEKVRAITTMWAETSPEFHGRFVNFDPIWIYPKPLQEPRPPVIVGGNSPRTLQRVLDFADGWMPIDRTGQPVTESPILERIVELRAAARGRRQPKPSVTIYSAPLSRNILDGYERAEVDRCVFLLPTASADITRSALSEAQAIMKSYR